MTKPGLKLANELSGINGTSGDLYDQILEVHEAKIGPDRIKEFKKLKQQFPELFDGTIREFNTSEVYKNGTSGAENFLAQVRRAYNQTIKSQKPNLMKNAQQLKEAYSGNRNWRGKIHVPPPKLTLHQVLSRYGRATYQTDINGTISDISNVSSLSKQQLISICMLNNLEVQLLHANKYSHYRIFLKVQFVSGNEKWISTPKLRLANNKKVEEFLNRDSGYWVTDDGYKYDDVIEKFLINLECQIVWR